MDNLVRKLHINPLFRKRITDLLKESKSKFHISYILFVIILVVDFISVLFGSISYIIRVSLRQGNHLSSIFLSSLILTTFFGLFYFAIDAIIQENTYELIGFIIVSLILRVRMIWSVFNLFLDLITSDDDLYRVLLVVTILIPGIFQAFCQVSYFIIFWPLKLKFGTKLYQKIGCNIKILKYFKTYQSFLVATKIDLLLLFTILPLIFLYCDQIWISYVFLGILMLLSFFSYYLVVFYIIKKEKRMTFIAYFCFQLVIPIYLIIKLIVIWFNVDSQIRDPLSIGESLSKIEVSINLTILFSIIICWRLIQCILSVCVMFNFDKGMKDVFLSQKKRNTITLFV